MGSSIKLNRRELQALDGMPWVCRLIYVFSLRRRMDYRTGVVGETAQISRPIIESDLEVSAGPGEKGTPAPKTDAIKRAISRLESAGLVKRINRPRQLLLHLPMAETDEYHVVEADTSGMTFEKLSKLKQAAQRSAQRSAQENDARPPKEPTTDSKQKQSVTEHPNARPPKKETVGRPRVRPRSRPLFRKDPDINKTHTACVRAKDDPDDESNTACVPDTEHHVSEVFAQWREVMAFPDARLDQSRTAVIQSALAMGYSAEQLKAAIDGCALSDWHMGSNDRGQLFNGLKTIFRDAEQIERFITAQKAPPKPPANQGETQTMGYSRPYLEKHALPGESWESAAMRLMQREKRKQHDNQGGP